MTKAIMTKAIMTKAPENAPALLFFGGDYNEEFFWGLRRRNNELHELTNFVGRRMGRQ